MEHALRGPLLGAWRPSQIGNETNNSQNYSQNPCGAGLVGLLEIYVELFLGGIFPGPRCEAPVFERCREWRLGRISDFLWQSVKTLLFSKTSELQAPIHPARPTLIQANLPPNRRSSTSCVDPWKNQSKQSHIEKVMVQNSWCTFWTDQNWKFCFHHAKSISENLVEVLYFAVNFFDLKAGKNM